MQTSLHFSNKKPYIFDLSQIQAKSISFITFA